MKKLTALAAMIIIVITACQKDEINLQEPNFKDKIINCRTCEGQWDLKDSIPK